MGFFCGSPATSLLGTGGILGFGGHLPHPERLWVCRALVVFAMKLWCMGCGAAGGRERILGFGSPEHRSCLCSVSSLAQDSLLPFLTLPGSDSALEKHDCGQRVVQWDRTRCSAPWCDVLCKNCCKGGKLPDIS